MNTRFRVGPCVPVCVFSLLATVGVAAAQDAARDAVPARSPVADAAPVDEADAGEQIETFLSSRVDWTIQLEPAVWFVSPSGEFSLPAQSNATAGDKIKIEELNLDTPLVSPFGELNMRAGDEGQWRFTFSAGDYSSDRQATAGFDFRLGDVSALAGDPLGVSFDFFTAEASVGYRIYERDFLASSRHPENAGRFLLTTYAFGGVRLYDVDIEFENMAVGREGESGTHQFFAEPIIGVRNELEIAGDFTIDLQLSAGALPIEDHSSYSVDIAVGFMYRPHPNFAAQIGWRQVAFWLSDGSDDSADQFEYDGRLAGLYAGITLRF